MRKLTTLCCLFAVLNLLAQTSRQFTVNLSADGRAKMEAYLPVEPSGRAVVDCPGGGYSHLSMQNEGHDWASWMNQRGIAYFVLTYRMPNGDRTIPIGDAQKAIRTVRDSADVWGINPRDVGVMGFSAGGHLASTVSTHSEYDCRPDFSILFYPVISMDERETHKGSVNGFLGQSKNDKALVRDFSNQYAVVRHLTPPAIILLANDDRAVPPVTNGIAYYSAMRRVGNECALHVYPSGGHGFGFRSNFAFHDQMLNDLSTWLKYHKAPRRDAQRVACIGNSITDGHGIDMATRHGYPAQLQQLLGSGYDVRNYGVSSRTLLNKGDHPFMKEQAWRDALAFRPDIVVIKLGTNDSKPENWQYGADFENDLLTMVNALKESCKSSKPQIYLCTPIPAFKSTWNISDSVISQSIIPVIRRVAKKQKLQLIDLHSSFTQEELMLPDGIHPNDKGARRLAELVAEAIKAAQ